MGVPARDARAVKTPKFFIPENQIQNGTAVITGGDARHIALALRLKAGGMVTVCCSGMDHVCEILSVSGETVRLAVRSSAYECSEPPVMATLFQATPKNDKFEMIIQKCVELGVHEIVPVLTEHTVVKPQAHTQEIRIKRYNKIAESAAKQSGRSYVPAVAATISLAEAAERAKGMDIRFVCHEKERARRAGDHIKRAWGAFEKDAVTAKTAAVFVGPEGGFSDGEIESLKKSGITAVSLGGRVLRTETAAFTALIILLYETGGL